jgi:hypothetical protein
MRHDVDFSVHRSYALAKIEAEEGVHSTYFLWPHCKYYNLFEEEIVEIVDKIIELGHDIGLHFDYDFYKKQRLDEDLIKGKKPKVCLIRMLKILHQQNIRDYLKK